MRFILTQGARSRRNWTISGFLWIYFRIFLNQTLLLLAQRQFRPFQHHRWLPGLQKEWNWRIDFEYHESWSCRTFLFSVLKIAELYWNIFACYFYSRTHFTRPFLELVYRERQYLTHFRNYLYYNCYYFYKNLRVTLCLRFAWICYAWSAQS